MKVIFLIPELGVFLSDLCLASNSVGVNHPSFEQPARLTLQLSNERKRGGNMPMGNLDKRSSIDAQLKLLVQSKDCEDNSMLVE